MIDGTIVAVEPSPRPEGLPEDGKRISSRLHAPRGPSDVIDPVRAKATQARLLIPAEVTDATGQRTFLRIELTFTRRESDGDWILTASGLHDARNDRPGLAAPPLK
jgi:hypothetical protein